MTWSFNGNPEKPTFTPSVKIRGTRAAVDYLCHYELVDGKLRFQNDCTHALRNQTVPLPELPPEYRDA